MQGKNNPTPKKENKRIYIIIVLIVIGILLLIIPNSTSNSNQKSGDPDLRLEEYAQRVESKISELCESVKGVGNVKVTVYFDS